MELSFIVDELTGILLDEDTPHLSAIIREQLTDKKRDVLVRSSFCRRLWSKKGTGRKLLVCESRIFLNPEQGNKAFPVREKIAARIRLVNWLKNQGVKGERIAKVWNLVG